MRVSRAIDEAADDEQSALLARIGTAVGKYWICKRTPAMVNEAQECLGGAGYVEEGILPRLYREAPLNSIWEGCGNIQCLDVLRAMARSQGSLDAFMDEIKSEQGKHRLLDAAIRDLESEFIDLGDIEVRARRVVEKMALTWQAALMVRSGNENEAEAFCAGRLDADQRLAFGTLPRGLNLDAIVKRAAPAV